MKSEILTDFFRNEKRISIKKLLLSNEDFESIKQFIYVFAETHKDRKRSVRRKISNYIRNENQVSFKKID